MANLVPVDLVMDDGDVLTAGEVNPDPARLALLPEDRPAAAAQRQANLPTGSAIGFVRVR